MSQGNTHNLTALWDRGSMNPVRSELRSHCRSKVLCQLSNSDQIREKQAIEFHLLEDFLNGCRVL